MEKNNEQGSVDLSGLEIAGVNMERLMRNLDETSYNEGSHDLACRLSDCREVIKALLAKAAQPAAGQVPEGYALVPLVPTEGMFVAFSETWFSKIRPIDDCGMEDCYDAMLAAAPVPPVPAAEQPSIEADWDRINAAIAKEFGDDQVGAIKAQNVFKSLAAPTQGSAPQAAPVAQEGEQGSVPAELTDQSIEEVWNTMPGGAAGWLKQFGYRQFARSIARHVLVRVAASMAGVISPTDDELWEQTIGERDYNAEMADKLAEAIAKRFGAEIGEHSNMNCPWANALEVVECAVRATQPTPSDSGSVDTPEFEVLMSLRDRALYEGTLEDYAVSKKALIAHIDSLIEARVAGVRKDADRYRWLRDLRRDLRSVEEVEDPDNEDGATTLMWGEGLDAAIDAAMAQSPASSKAGGAA